MRCYLEELSEQDRLRSRQPETNQDPHLSKEFTYAHRCSNRALDFLRQFHDKDFLLVVSYDEPHHPFLCPRPYSEMHQGYAFPKSPNLWDTLEDKPEHHRVWAGERLGLDKDQLRIVRSDFFGCNSFVDNEIGRVLEGIDAQTPAALVIYTSDHGDMLCSHSLDNKGPAMYDEITNVPFLVRWPGCAPAGAVTEQPISLVDVVPTVLDLMGVEQPPLLQGQSLLPALRSPDHRINDAVFMEFHRYEVDHDGFGGFQPIRACFDGRFKLVINLLASDELYDLEKDPGEHVPVNHWPTKTKLRGMAVQFQREMTREGTANETR